MSGHGVEARGDATVDPISSNTARKAAIKYSSEEWESQKERIKQLYLVEGRPLCSKDVPGESVTQLMEERYGFKATERQYKRRIEMWKFKKYIRGHEIEAVLDMSEINRPGSTSDSGPTPCIESRKIKRYQRRQILRALRDVSPSPPPTDFSTTPPRTSPLTSSTPPDITDYENDTWVLQLEFEPNMPGMPLANMLYPPRIYKTRPLSSFPLQLISSLPPISSCPPLPPLPNNRVLKCHPSELIPISLNLCSVVTLYRKDRMAGEVRMPSSALKTPGFPHEQDWLALFVAEGLVIFQQHSIAEFKLDEKDSGPEQDPALFIEGVRALLRVMQLSDNTIAFAVACMRRIVKASATDISWTPHYLLIVGLMLANQLMDDTPYPKSSWVEVSGIELHVLQYFELRALNLPNFRPLKPPPDGWILFLDDLKNSVLTMKHACRHNWPQRYKTFIEGRLRSWAPKCDFG